MTYNELKLPKFTHIPVAKTTTNIGDDIQSASADLLWNVGKFVNRDDFKTWNKNSIIPFIGWYGYDLHNDLPKTNCFLISFHLSPNTKIIISRNPKHIQWFRDKTKEQGFPALTRDIPTRDFLRSYKIDSEFVGCITETLPKYEGSRNGMTVSIDAPFIDNCDLYTSNYNITLPNQTMENRVKIAKSYITFISKCQLIHTNRLHIALPCKAMGTPYKFYDYKIYDPNRLIGHQLL